MVLMSVSRVMNPSSAVDSAVGDDGRGEVGRSVDIYAILCNSGVIQTMSRAKIVNRSRSPRLNEAHLEEHYYSRLRQAVLTT